LGISIASAYARQNPEAAAVWFESIPYPKEDLLQGVLQGLQQSNSGRALDLVANELGKPDSLARAEMRSNLRDYLLGAINDGSVADIAKILSRIGDIDNGSMGSVRDYVFSQWASRDPVSALNLALETAGQLDVSTFAAIGSALAIVDEGLSEQAIERIPPVAQERWVRSVVATIFATDPGRALDLVLRVPTQELRDFALSELLVSQSAGGTVDRALLPMIVDNIARQEASRTVAEMLAASNAELANEIAQTFIHDTALRQKVLDRIASGEAARDPFLEIQRSRRVRQGASRD
jgi:hypothetical protein